MADSLIETVRIVDGVAPLWPLHRWRLMNSALILGLPLPELDAPKGGADRVVRIEFGSEGVQVTERDVDPAESITLASSPAPHRGYPHKTTGRTWLEAASALSRTAGAEDALMFDASGRLIEATRWAVGWWEGDTLCFPPLTLGGLKSVARARLVELARANVRDAVLTRGELGKRSFVACNAARGIVPVSFLDGTVVVENSRTKALARRFWDRPAA